MKWHLWVDDEREPCDYDDVLANDWHWAKSAYEAQELIEKFGEPPAYMVLDMDLGDPAITGMSVLTWMRYSKGYGPPEVSCISRSMDAQRMVYDFLDDWTILKEE